ncbi:hypothetical protein [Mycolicibacterium sphagni]|uniref:Uncharacterized protein n=1 Tax=Mycolicibacterium sphagni TaxID=1786 RepID=A0ABX2JL86_9MYCO|nr:hypothetical protein [Mycolicibacterium sphagni]NTY58434.1 hypothetical protein [Mycolicibacterium sphagni]
MSYSISIPQFDVDGFEGGWAFGPAPLIAPLEHRLRAGRRSPHAVPNPTGASLAEDREQMERRAAEVISQLS